ncbi:MAG: metalloregulator ArsR/SmtB family transcription factor [Eubacteriales bacterium]|nr:metalloregulator ArsR/SmtB family transcription factor [Eubacteriales bacterium]MDD4717752.1 metalloregulator ArsR/SmtB family transcription factor [Eubacteriales bacterium]
MKKNDLKRNDEEDQALDDLTELFKILGDHTRLRILRALVDSEMQVGQIAERLDMTASAISHQLRVLKQAKLVRGSREGKAIRYSIDDEHVELILRQGLVHVKEGKTH